MAPKPKHACRIFRLLWRPARLFLSTDNVHVMRNRGVLMFQCDSAGRKDQAAEAALGDRLSVQNGNDLNFQIGAGHDQRRDNR
jgi:hypothetical protein